MENSDNILEVDWLVDEFHRFATRKARKLALDARPLSAEHTEILWDEYRKGYDRRKAFRVAYRRLFGGK